MLASTEILDWSTGHWQPSVHLPHPTYGGCVVSLNDEETRHILFGGSNGTWLMDRYYIIDWEDEDPAWEDRGSYWRAVEHIRSVYPIHCAHCVFLEVTITATGRLHAQNLDINIIFRTCIEFNCHGKYIETCFSPSSLINQ